MSKHKEKKSLKPLKIFTTIGFLILSGILVFFVHRLNIVPNKYMIFGSLILLFINLIAAILLFRKKTVPKVFACLIYLFIIVISIFGIHFANITNKFLEQATNNTIKTFSLKYLILSKTNYSENDLNNKDIYYYNNSEYNADAIEKINQKFTVNLVLHDDLMTIFEQEIFLIDEAAYNLFIEDFNINPDNYYVIYTIDLNYEIEDDIKTEKELDKDKHYFNIFVGAYDFSGLRMDMSKIVTINTKTNEILITNIDRFSYLTVPGYSQKNRLDEISAYGLKNLFNALETTIGIKFDYYLIAKAEGLVTLVDDLGGIEYCSDMAFTTYHAKVINTYDNRGAEHVKVKKGCQRLDGIETLTVARERMAFKNGTHQRDKNTTAILLDIVDEVKKPSNLNKLSTILNDVNGLYYTSIPRDLITTGVKQYLNKGWNIETQELTGKQKLDKIFFSNVKGYVAILTQENIDKVREKIESLDK